MARACSAISTESGESIAGTALSQTTRWLLLELPGSWAAEPIMSPAITDSLRVHLQRVLEQAPGTRLQLIRGQAADAAGLALIVVRSGPSGGWVHRLQLPSLEALLAVDIRSLWETDPGDSVSPFILCCAHGMRDPCCARAGTPVAHALSALRPGDVWQTSHLGGHRFAATAVVLPWGVHLGRLTPEEAEPLWAAIDADSLHRLDRYRGSTALTNPAQAAAIFLREQSGELGLDWIVHRGTEPIGEGCTLERFSLPAGQTAVRVVAECWGEPRATSCTSDKLKRPTRYRCAVELP
jgi:hypothetical protein